MKVFSLYYLFFYLMEFNIGYEVFDCFVMQGYNELKKRI